MPEVSTEELAARSVRLGEELQADREAWEQTWNELEAAARERSEQAHLAAEEQRMDRRQLLAWVSGAIVLMVVLALLAWRADLSGRAVSVVAVLVAVAVALAVWNLTGITTGKATL